MDRVDFSSADWWKSSWSADAGCVEVAVVADFVGVRDTKDRGNGPVLVLGKREWAAFVSGAPGGKSDPR